MVLFENVWPFLPESGATESYDYLTEVMETYSTEQRINLRAAPRRSFTYRHLLDQEQLAVAQLKMRRYNTTTPMFIPLWSEGLPITSIASAATTIVVDKIKFYSFEVGDSVIFWLDWDDYYVRSVTEVSDSGISWDTSIGVDLEQVIVLPMKEAQAYRGFGLNQGNPSRSIVDVTWTLRTNEKTLGFVRHDMFDSDDIFDRPDIFRPLLELYNGLYVRIEKPYRISSVSKFIEIPTTIFDNGFGPIEVEAQYDFIKGRHSIELFYQGFEQQRLTREFVTDLFGRLNTFYLPTHDNDLVPVAGTYSSTSLDIVEAGAVSGYLGRDIMIEMSDGATSYNNIVNATVSTGVITLTLSTAISIDTANVLRVCFLNLVRSDVDTLELTNSLQDQGKVKFNLIEVS